MFRIWYGSGWEKFVGYLRNIKIINRFGSELDVDFLADQIPDLNTSVNEND